MEEKHGKPPGKKWFLNTLIKQMKIHFLIPMSVTFSDDMPVSPFLIHCPSCSIVIGVVLRILLVRHLIHLQMKNELRSNNVMGQFLIQSFINSKFRFGLRYEMQIWLNLLPTSSAQRFMFDTIKQFREIYHFTFKWHSFLHSALLNSTTDCHDMLKSMLVSCLIDFCTYKTLLVK